MPRAVVIACAGDVSTEDGAERLVEYAAGELGGMDVLVNAAGIPLIGPAEELDGASWAKCIDTNLAGTFYCCREAWRHMSVRGGSIVNITSVAARVALPFRAAYGASKAGVEAMTRTLACEWASLQIRVNAIAPGFIATPLDEFAEGVVGGYSDEDIRGRTPLGRKGMAEEVASAALFLASDEAAFITGTTLVVDGGWMGYGGWGKAFPLARPSAR